MGRGSATAMSSFRRLRPSRPASQLNSRSSAKYIKKMSDFDKGASLVGHSATSRETRSKGIKEIEEAGDHLYQLLQQIEDLDTHHSRQAFLRFEAEAFILIKKRVNQFRVGEKILPQSSLELKQSGTTHINTQLLDRKPGNKNSAKLYKLMKYFFESGIDKFTENRFLSFLAQKHKMVVSDSIRGLPTTAYYNEHEIRKVKSYHKACLTFPALGIEFDNRHNNSEEDQEKSGSVRSIDSPQEIYEEEKNCFEERPRPYSYQVDDLNPVEVFRGFVNKNKKQLFKGAKLLSRMKFERENMAKKLAYLCVKEVGKRYKKCLKNQSEYLNRAKKIHREGLLYWRKRDKELTELKKKKEKIEQDIKKRNEEKQEEETQKKKLEFLMKQSVLYSHFMAKKLGMEPEKHEVLDNKHIQVDEEAAHLNVEQIITKKMDTLEKFDGESHLDLSKVELQDDNTQINGPPPIFQGTLKDYQVKGLKWLYSLNLQGINGILADEMGLGKTIQAIALLSHIGYTQGKWGPFLIVSPSSTLHNWQQQFKRFCPSMKILPYWGGIKQRKVIRKYFSTKKFTSKHDSRFHVVITSYQMAVVDQKTFRKLKWQFIVLDEAHNIKNTMSQRWNVLKEFDSRSRLLLTGTPIQNNMTELWALLNFIMPELFDSHEQFNEWFSKDIEAHSQNQKQLDKIQIQRLHAILKPFMLRRIKKDVEHEIGRKFETQILCEMTKRQKVLYDSIKKKLNLKELFRIVESKIKVENLMNLVMQLRKVCNHPQLFERRPPNSPFMFQEMYYYTGFTPLKAGEVKFIPYHSINPIEVYLPKLIYESLIGYSESLSSRNKRMLNLFSHFNLNASQGFSCLQLLNLSGCQLQTCFQEDPMYTGILLMHWLKTNSSAHTLSTKMYINQIGKRCDPRFEVIENTASYKCVQSINIPAAIAPTINFTVPSHLFLNRQQSVCLNKFHLFILEGKYQRQWSHSLPVKDWKGILPDDCSLTKIELVNLDSLVADSAKLEQLDKILKEKRAQRDKVLIFCQMTKMLDILQDFMNLKKYPFFRLDGACSLSDRRDMVNDFQRANSKVFVFLLSTRAGGLGVTLTAANNVIFYDNDWNPTMDAQATDRAHRIGQTRDVYVYQLVTKNTIEDRIVKRAEEKKTVQSTVYEGGSLNIFRKEIMELMADELGVETKQEQKKEEAAAKKRGPKAVKPTFVKTKDRDKSF